MKLEGIKKCVKEVVGQASDVAVLFQGTQVGALFDKVVI